MKDWTEQRLHVEMLCNELEQPCVKCAGDEALLRQALEALELRRPPSEYPRMWHKKFHAAVDAIRARLEKS